MPVENTPSYQRLKDVRDSSPVIYGLMDERQGKIVYVGKTKNLRNRVSAYRSPKGCHNPLLAEWLKEIGDNVRVVILEREPGNLSESELKWILKYQDNLFNLVHGDPSTWMSHTRYPWMAGMGIKCPSDILIHYLLNRHSLDDENTKHQIDFVKEKRHLMTVNERVCFELSLCMDYWDKHFLLMNKWLSDTHGRLLDALEMISHSRKVSENG